MRPAAAMLLALAALGWPGLLAAEEQPGGQLFLLDLAGAEGAEAQAGVLFGGKDANSGYRLRFTAKQVTLACLQDGKQRELARAGTPDWRAARELAIQRLGARITVAVDGRAILLAKDETHQGTYCAVETTAGLGVKLRRVQRLGDIAFSDDFMRAAPEGTWTPLAGFWQLTGKKAESQSANAFALFARFKDSPAEDELFAERTRRFTGIGVRTEYRNDRAEIVGVYPDTPAAAAGLKTGDAIVAIDGETAIGTSREDIVDRVLGPPDSEVTVSVERTVGLRKARKDFTLRRQRLDLDRVDRDVPVEPAQVSDQALMTAGHHFWSDYTLQANGSPLGGGAWGLAFCVRDKEHLYRLEWGDALRLVRAWDGRRTVLAERPGGFSPGQYYELRVQVQDDEIRGFVDGFEALRARAPELSWGQVGLWASGGRGVRFDDVRCGLTTGFREAQRAWAAQGLFQADRIMRKWANPAEDWKPLGADYWHKYAFPGDLHLTFTRPKFQKLTAEMNAEHGKPGTGYSVILDGQRRDAALYRRDKRVGEFALKADEIEQLDLERREKRVTVRINGQEAANFEDTEPLRGDGVRMSGLQGLPVQVAPSPTVRYMGPYGMPAAGPVVEWPIRLTAPQVWEYGFEEMPVDWWVASGQWGVMNRWICTPTWSWFGGRSQDIAAIWTKRAFGGDLALDVFASFVMKAYRHFPYERPADLCLTLCGDGRNLSSGYALIVGAENNTVTQLYRRGALVASSRDKAALIIARQSRDPSGVDLHHDWLHLRLTRRGPKVQFELNGTPALSYVDPEPLPEGHVALWTVNNGVLFARVRMAFERQLPPVPPRSDAAEFADAHWTNVRDGLVSAAVQKSADGHIVQSLGSGPVAVQSQLAPVDVAANPILAFDYRIDPGAKVDLYFDLEQMQHRLALTGPKTPPEDVMDIGRLDVAADGRWHRAAIRLHDCLRSQYPDGRSFVVSHLTFGNFSNEGLLLAGFGGNAAGAQYAIRDFRLGPATGSAPPTVARLICPFDEPDNASALVFCLRSEDDAGSDPSDAQIQVNDQSFSLSHAAVRFDFGRQRLALDLADAGFTLRDGERLRIRLSGLRSRAGVAMREPFEATWTFDQRKDKQGPRILAVRGGRGPLATYDFEQGLGDCEGLRPRNRADDAALTCLARETQTAASGRYSLKVQNTKQRREFAVVLQQAGFNAGRYPLLTFDCRMPAGRGMDVSGEMGRRRSLMRLMPSPAWARHVCDLYDLLKRLDPTVMEYRLSQLRFGNDVFSGEINFGSAALHLDNIQLWPVLGLKDLEFSCQASDLSGVRQPRAALNRMPLFTPEADQAPTTFASIGDGLAYYHVMLCDGAGNWGEVFHQPVVLDLSPPRVQSASAEGSTLKFVFDESRGLDPQSVRVAVGPKTYTVDNDRLWYDQSQRTLTLRLGTDYAGLFGERNPIAVQIEGAQDFAGNALTGPRAWLLPKNHRGGLAATAP